MIGSLSDNLKDITYSILYDYDKGRAIDQQNIGEQPNKHEITDITDKLLRIIYPCYFKNKLYRSFNTTNTLTVVIEDVTVNLSEQVAVALKSYHPDERVATKKLSTAAEEITLDFLKTIPRIREYVDTDVQATLEGDPAAFSTSEIIVAYPGLYAITVHRLAHELSVLGVPLVPRIMSEYAHSETGIDIGPGATIGNYFFIDHGTGIVIGETSVIGEHVKLYQGVTLGALSTRAGRKLKGVKRHPTIEDNVTIYSGASILGGDTVIGAGSVIGGNVFITKSVAPNTRVSVKNQELRFDEGKKLVKTVEESALLDESWFYSI